MRKATAAFGVAASLAVAGLTAAPAGAAVVAEPATTVYDATLDPLPPNTWSLGYQATQTAEFGDAVELAGSNRYLQTATIAFSDWATQASWPDFDTGDSTGWDWPITVNVYAADDLSTPLGTVTDTVHVPWRPAADSVCSDDAWQAEDGECYHGFAFEHTFDVSSAGLVPDDVVVTVAYNTQTWGASPTGEDGPYNSLNVLLRDTSATGDGPVPVGQDLDSDAVLWNTATASNYSDGGTGGVGVLRADTNWGGYTPAMALTASATGCSFVQDDTAHTLTLTHDCTTDQTIQVPDGYTLDGDGHTITAVDPAGEHFIGPVLTNETSGGDGISVTDVTVTADGLADVCDGGTDRLRGILVDGTDATIDGVTVTGVRQGASGCQEGNAIEARNFNGANAASPAVHVTITNSTVSDYQKNGITVNGGVVATVTGNSVTGDGPISYIAQNGIQIGFGASATVSGNAVADNYYTGPDVACGLLLYQANGVKQKSNVFSGNERDVCNYGRGGGKVSSTA